MDKRVPKINDYIRWVILSDQTILLYNMRNAQYLDIKAPLTVRVWEALDGRRDLEQTTEHVNAQNDGSLPRITARSLGRLLEGMQKMDLISMQDVSVEVTGLEMPTS